MRLSLRLSLRVRLRQVHKATFVERNKPTADHMQV